MTEKCKETVKGEFYLGGAFRHHHQCENNAKKDGYCGIHHPDAVKRRREKAEARYKKRFAEQDAYYIQAAFDARAGDRCRELGIQPEDIKA